jgi:hypothetical protein
MGQYYNPVMSSPDNLALNMDAANIRSYSGSGNTWSDLSAYSNSGALTSVTFGGSGATSALVFNGTSSLINLGTPSGANVTTAWTVESWIKPTNAGATNAARVYVHSTESLTGFVCALDNSAVTNGIQLNTYAISGFSARIGNCITNGSWQQVVWAFSAGSVTFYVNGSAVGTSSVTSPSSFTGTDYIGNRAGTANTFNGSISLVRLYRGTLTAADVLQNFNAHRSRYSI